MNWFNEEHMKERLSTDTTPFWKSHAAEMEQVFSRRFPFEQPMLDQLPNNLLGVYALFRNSELIYYGESCPDDPTNHCIKGRLQRHLDGEEQGGQTKSATEFDFVLTQASEAVETMLTRSHELLTGNKPPYNDR